MTEQEFLEKYAEKISALRLSDFKPLIGDAFSYGDAAGKRHLLALSSVEEGRHNRDLFESFTLTFTSSREIFFPQGHYLLSQEKTGEFPLFLVPVASLDPQRNAYCAYFNRKL